MWVRGLKQKDGHSNPSTEASHPMWVRGLKQGYIDMMKKKIVVAPHVGAWIETRHSILVSIQCASHPMWVRGLKPLLACSTSLEVVSHPMWVRGLKLNYEAYISKDGSRTPCGCVD